MDEGVKDRNLDDLILRALESGCELKAKRSPKVLVSKQKFHSWGGKRNGASQKSTKIVIRTVAQEND